MIRWFRNTSIRNKMISTFGVILIMSWVLVLTSLTMSNRIADEGVEAAIHEAPLIDACMEAKLLATQAHLLFEEIMTGDASEDISAVRELLDDANGFLKVILEGGSFHGREYIASDSPEALALCSQSMGQLDEFRELVENRHSGLDLSDNAEVRFDATFDTYMESVDAIEEVLLEKMDHATQLILTTKKNNQTLLIFFLVGGGAMLISASLIILSLVSKPVIALSKGMNDVGTGDLTVELEVNSEDELGQMTVGFNDLVKRLAANKQQAEGVQTQVQEETENLSSVTTALKDLTDLLGEKSTSIADQSNMVAAAAEEMSTNMDTISQASQASQENMSSVAGATEQMTSTVGEIANSAEKARTITHKAVQSVASASQRVNDLGDAAKAISQVTDTIVEIAEQTKLLALNATIEAARAGEAGKGFAVVANEVKELAKQTNDATADISNKINAIQDKTDGTVTEISGISSVIEDVNEIVNSIATAVEEQNVTTQDIAKNIGQATGGLNEVVNNVSQAATASREIATNMATVNTDIGSVKMTGQDLQNTSMMINETGSQLEDMAAKLTS